MLLKIKYVRIKVFTAQGSKICLFFHTKRQSNLSFLKGSKSAAAYLKTSGKNNAATAAEMRKLCFRSKNIADSFADYAKL